MIKSNQPIVRTIIANKNFEGIDIYLDGHTWNGCTFKDCNIVLEYGNFDLMNCGFMNCTLSARGPAVGILKVTKLFFPFIPLIEEKPIYGQKEQRYGKEDDAR